MGKAVSFNLSDDFIGGIADFVEENYLNKGSDISKLAFVFEGKRPSLFLEKALSKKIGRSFFPPSIFSIDEFVQYVLSKKGSSLKMPAMESWYAVYILAMDIAPGILKGREKFSQFLPWAREIVRFMDILDFEDIPEDSLKNIQANAKIGYEIPESINKTLENIIALRAAYHKLLDDKKSFSKGYAYISASRAVGEISFEEFDMIFFCGFFYMRETEKKLIKHLYDTGKTMLFFQGDEDDWPLLKNLSREFSCSIKPGKKGSPSYALNLYSAFDRHSQVCTVKQILGKKEKQDSTVIVLPDPESMIPLVSEIGNSAGKFNVSLGYPLRRSSLYSLFELIFQAQKSKRDDGYYAKDYISALSQPIVKNLRILSDHSATRILVHKVEEALLGMEDVSISGSLFIKPQDVENENILFELASGTLKHMDIEAEPAELQNVLRELHILLFTMWEDVTSFRDFVMPLGKFLDTVLKKSSIESYPLNLKIADRLYSMRDELANSSFSGENFSKEEIFRIFQDAIENEMVAFSGSPLRGLQILGTLETRSLNFENVIIMDANEPKMPELRIREPLIPRDVTAGLGIGVIEKEEEMQRYLFTRILSSAKNVHIVYEENQEKEKSRFVEELIWRIQEKEKRLDAVPVPAAKFSVNMLPAKTGTNKNEKIIEYLKNFRYSPTSVDMYLHCPLRFYYRYVLGLKEKKELPEDPEGREIGSFIHELLKDTFAVFLNKKPVIDEMFRRNFFSAFDKKFEKTFKRRMRSDSFLLKDVMKFRLERFLDSEAENNEKKTAKIISLEQKLEERLELSGDVFNFTYIMDRLDRLEDKSLLIIDYKTGSDTPKPKQTGSLEKMELNRESIRDTVRSFQLPLYYHFEKKRCREETLDAALYNLRNLKLTFLSGKNTDIGRTEEICLKALDFIIHEIIDPEKMFEADSGKENYCKNCPFNC